jgi:chromosome partitioning protein
MAIVALVNQKGGVGKTSTTMHLGGALARRGLKVLVVDNDPQSSLTKGLLGVGPARALDPATTIYALYAELPVPPEDLIRQTGFAGLSLLAGSRMLVTSTCPDPTGSTRPTRSGCSTAWGASPLASTSSWSTARPASS